MLVVEGGWTSGSVTGVSSTPDLQARYIRRQMQIADNAKLAGVFQITFTDFDMASFPVPPESILPLFAQLGLVDVNFRAKPWGTCARTGAIGRAMLRAFPISRSEIRIFPIFPPTGWIQSVVATPLQRGAS